MTPLFSRFAHPQSANLTPKGKLIVNLAPKIAIFKPKLVLTINLSDIHPEILAKLYDFDKKQQEEILLEARKRLFKTFYPYYFNMVANLVKVRIEP
jgi:hypothetical protein